jgi:hypothetical protein
VDALTGMKKLGPGIYADGIGTMHLDVRELLEANGWPDTPENRAILEQQFREYCRASGIPVIETEDPLDTGGTGLPE